MRIRLLTVLFASTALLLGACNNVNEGEPGTETELREVPLYRVTGVGVSEEQGSTLATLFELGTNAIVGEHGAINYLDMENFQRVPTTASGQTESPEEEEGTFERQFFQFNDLEGYQAPSEGQVLDMAAGAFRQAEVHPEQLFAGDDFQIIPSFGHSLFEAVGADGNVDAEAELDTQLMYDVNLSIGNGRFVPYSGPGAKVKLVLDGNNTVTQIFHSVRTLEKGNLVEITPRQDALEQCQETYRGQELEAKREGSEPGTEAEVEVDTELVYFAPPLDVAVDAIYPYYLCTGSIPEAEEDTLLRQVLLPAVADAPDANEITALPAPEPASLTPQAPGRYDVGIEWIGESQGLGGSEDNAGGFADTFAAEGYPVQFNWGDNNAWEQDFKDPSFGGDDSNWVDDVDAVFYTGHADANGFSFPGNNDDGKLHHSEASWGERELEWLFIAACGPLQAGSSGDRWWQRWGDSFSGLHLLMAYANVSYDNTREGRIIAETMLGAGGDAPQPVRLAWVRAATEVQPSSVTYAYMGVYGSDFDTNFNDYFWGHGSGGGPDITDPAGYWRVSSPS